MSQRGRPKLMSQEIVRREVREALEASKISLRQLSTRVGLKGHASLSRFLTGHGRLSLQTIVLIARELGIEGRAWERLLLSQIPAEFLAKDSGSASRPHDTNYPIRRRRSRLSRFFVIQKAPLVYETVKLMNSASVDQILGMLHPKVRCGRHNLLACLQHLEALGLVRSIDNYWQAVDKRRDIIIPSKYSTEMGRRIIQESFATHGSFTRELGKGVMCMRSMLSTVRLPKEPFALRQIEQSILRMRDDVLELQGDNDNAVVSVLVSAVVLAKRDGDKG